ncbi:MAG: hypothetical protein GX587_15190 [Bacteroidales bacterium]|nr:hypothetical protein [Bacteroidales bacterium]
MSNLLMRILFFVLLSALAFITSWQNIELRGENKRLENNYKASYSEIERWKTKDSLNVATVYTYVCNNAELFESNVKLEAELDELKIKNKRLQSIVALQTGQFYNISTKIRDKVIAKKQVIDSVTVIKYDTVFYSTYSDKWIDFNQQFEKDGEVKSQIKTRDSLLIVNHIEPYRFWFIKWGKKAIKTTVKSYSPYSNIDFVVSITKSNGQ